MSYIEKEVLAKYSLSSFAPIGINNIHFDTAKNPLVNIGNFQVSIDFSGKNSDILTLIDSIQQSGKLTIQNGKLVSNGSKKTSGPIGLSDLSNLLIGIPSLSLSSILENNTLPNSGTLVLEFYVEGMNTQKIRLLQNMLTTRFETLKKDIKANGGLCSQGDNVLCQNGTTNGAVSAIKNLGRSIVELQPTIDGFKTTQKLSIDRILDELITLQSTIQNIETIYTRNFIILSKAKSNSTHK